MENYEEDKKNAESGKLLQQSKYVSDNWALEEIAKHKNTKLDTLNQMVQKFPEGSKIGDIVRNRLKTKNIIENALQKATVNGGSVEEAYDEQD
jgi:hypothetical protein